MSEAFDDWPESAQTDAQIRRASALLASYNVATGLNTKGEKAPGFMTTRKERQLAADRRRRAKQKAAREGAPDQRGPRAKERGERQRAERGTCINGHPLTADNVSTSRGSHFVCLSCRRARNLRVTEMRRLASALRAQAPAAVTGSSVELLGSPSYLSRRG
jgi:hypothetical protein